MAILRISGNVRHTSGRQSRVTRIVIHGTVSPCTRGGARSVARYFQSDSAGGSAHYVVDPGEVVRCYDERTICWHAPPNTNTIGVELCDPQKGPTSRWRDDDHEAMLQRAAALVRQIAARWSVPLTRLTVAEVKAGKRGICGHVDVSKAFGQTDHSDPGSGFPWAHFMELVRDGDGPADDISWTEELVKDLPLLRPGADSFDVKTLRANLFVRGGLATARYGGSAGLKAWMEHTVYDPDLVTDVRAFQRGEGLDDDALVGPKTWAALLRVA